MYDCQQDTWTEHVSNEKVLKKMEAKKGYLYLESERDSLNF